MNGFTIPFARTDVGRLVQPFEGKSGAHYTCPQCSTRVVWRRCDERVRRSHFAHLPSDSCGGESVTHKSAKLLAAQQIDDWLMQLGPRPSLLFSCSVCQRVREIAFPDVEAVHVERARPDGLVPDVSLDAATPGYIEICHRHPIGEEKVAAFFDDGAWWIELKASDVLTAFHFPRWHVLRSAGIDVECVHCLENQVRAVKAAVLDIRKLDQAIEERKSKVDELDEREAVLTRRALGLRELLQSLERLHEEQQQANDAALRVLKSARDVQANLRCAVGYLQSVSDSLGTKEARPGGLSRSGLQRSIQCAADSLARVVRSLEKPRAELSAGDGP